MMTKQEAQKQFRDLLMTGLDIHDEYVWFIKDLINELPDEPKIKFTHNGATIEVEMIIYEEDNNDNR